MVFNEERLKILIEKAVKQVINEMSLKRKDFIDYILGELIQIFENWCLVRYCVLNGQEKYKKHWSDELYTHIMNIQALSLKGNNNYDYKYKAIYNTFDKYDLFDHNVIDGRISLKFRKEGIDRKNIIYSEIIDDCIKNHHNLMDVLANDPNPTKIIEFINKLNCDYE